MKRNFIAIVLLLTLLFSKVNFADSGLLFNVNASGDPTEVSITLCLNAKGPLSCQNYFVSATNLTILTTPSDHTYHYAGIKVNSPFYSIANAGISCTPLSNGFCMFTVSDTQPAAISIKNPDYIVVGVGTAGAVITKKLSDGNQNMVVALHNGPDLNNDPLINLSKNAIITVLSGLIGPPLYNISETIPQIFINDRILNWIYAIPLGGASSVNAGAWCRGTNQVYSQWEALLGPNWSTTAIENTYIELENYHGETTNPSARGFNGPLPIRQEPNPTITTVSRKISQAITNATGFSLVLDYNDPNTPIGPSTQVQYTQMGPDGALRASSAIVFLNKDVMDANGNGVNGRKLHVVFNATADKVIWNGNKAIGVQYYRNGSPHLLYASKGIIVSAGIKSSSFLMRSGVGSASLLQSLNIPVVYDNPNVGSGLADQPHIVMIYTSNPDDTPSSFRLKIAGKILSALSDTTLGRALITAIGTNVNVQNGLFTQIAWLPTPGGDPTIRTLRFASVTPIPGITIVLFDLVQPLSRGSIAINSTDPFAEPTFDLGVLSNVDDLDLYISGFQNYIQNINNQLQVIDPSYQMIFPDPIILNDLTVLTDFIKEEIGTNMHFQSHCRMAPLNQGGVVDDTGHVYGVQNLIVADDSVVPINMDGSPMATAYLVAANIAKHL